MLLRGVNLAGGELDYGTSNTTNPVSGTDYLFISHQDIDYLASKNISFVRLLISWEVLQPTLNQPLANNAYNSTLQDLVAYITSKNITVMLEPHGGSDKNFARYKGNLVGSSAVPNSAFADFWARMATQFKNNSLVMFGLSNEPNNMSTMQWFNAAQAAINGIRSTGSNAMIMVPGNGWTGSSSWSNSWYDTASPQVSNATAWKTLSDPANNLCASVHMYFDANAGGGGTDIVSATVGVDRVSAVTNWARSNGVKLHISEFGCSSANSMSPTAVKNFCDYVEANKDVVIGWSWWAYGPPAWWGNYQFTLDPKNNYTTDDVKWSWLAPYLVAPVVQPPPPPPPPPPSNVSGLTLTDTTNKMPGDQGFQVSKVVPTGQSIPAGTYILKTATRTVYSDQSSACVNVIFENDYNDVDMTWQSITVDLRGHTLQNVWNASVKSSSGTTITFIPNAGTEKVLAHNKNNFGFCFMRMTDPTKAYYQVLVKSIVW